jgi:hypothetical protein
VGRTATAQQKENPTAVLKDIDLLESGRTFVLGPRRKKILHDQVSAPYRHFALCCIRTVLYVCAVMKATCRVAHNGFGR